MTNQDDLTDQTRRADSANSAHLVETKVVGSGISETKSLGVAPDDDGLVVLPRPWTEHRAMMVQLFTPAFQRSLQCPGRDRAQCCQAPGESCFPNWREREDPEWYAREIDMLLTLLDQRILEQGTLVPALAADEAFELGCLFTEALKKFRWGKDVKRGLKTLNSAKEGGLSRRGANPARRSVAQTVEAVDALLLTNTSLTAAYRKVAKQQCVTDQTIAKEYRTAKKQR